MTGSRARIVVASVAAVLMVAVFAGTVGASPERGPITTISAEASTYSSPHWTPNRVKIDPGTRVEWLALNDDHVLVAYGDNWTFNHSLPEGGRYEAIPTPRHLPVPLHHPLDLVNGVCQGMCGKVVVH